MELDYWEKQLILYTKGHYLRIDYEKDLKHFPSNMYGIGLEYTGKDNEIHMVVDLYEKLSTNNSIDFKLNSFLTSIFKRAWLERDAKEASWDDVIREILGEVQGMVVQGRNFELGTPDKELLALITNDK